MILHFSKSVQIFCFRCIVLFFLLPLQSKYFLQFFVACNISLFITDGLNKRLELLLLFYTHAFSDISRHYSCIIFQCFIFHKFNLSLNLIVICSWCFQNKLKAVNNKMLTWIYPLLDVHRERTLILKQSLCSKRSFSNFMICIMSTCGRCSSIPWEHDIQSKIPEHKRLNFE